MKRYIRELYSFWGVQFSGIVCLFSFENLSSCERISNATYHSCKSSMLSEHNRHGRPMHGLWNLLPFLLKEKKSHHVHGVTVSLSYEWIHSSLLASKRITPNRWCDASYAESSLSSQYNDAAWYLAGCGATPFLRSIRTICFQEVVRCSRLAGNSKYIHPIYTCAVLWDLRERGYHVGMKENGCGMHARLSTWTVSPVHCTPRAHY